MFNPNGGFMYIIVTIVIIFVIAESIYFLFKAWRRAIKIGMRSETLKRVVISSAVFTIAPAVAILLGVIALSKALGFPLPWLRLSVIGAITYETTAAATAASVHGVTLSNMITDPKIFSSITWVMTVGIIPGLILVPLIGKRIENGLTRIKTKDQKWSEVLMSALFLGMISAFLGMIFASIRQGLVGWIPVFVMLASAVLMAVCGLLCKKLKAKWLEDYALPISMLGGMALSIPITNFINSIV